MNTVYMYMSMFVYIKDDIKVKIEKKICFECNAAIIVKKELTKSFLIEQHISQTHFLFLCKWPGQFLHFLLFSFSLCLCLCTSLTLMFSHTQHSCKYFLHHLHTSVRQSPIHLSLISPSHFSILPAEQI